jgi:hypothetical protein
MLKFIHQQFIKSKLTHWFTLDRLKEEAHQHSHILTSDSYKDYKSTLLEEGLMAAEQKY